MEASQHTSTAPVKSLAAPLPGEALTFVDHMEVAGACVVTSALGLALSSKEVAASVASGMMQALHWIYVYVEIRKMGIS